MTEPRIVSEPRGDAGDATFVRDRLGLFNVAVTGDSYYRPLAIFLKDERDAVLGGALGHVWGGWLDLDVLWVAEPFRGQGYGAKLLRAVEDQRVEAISARHRACEDLDVLRRSETPWEEVEEVPSGGEELLGRIRRGALLLPPEDARP